ncbi:unnamed protein product, partial [Closterium sp. NIES-54]
PRPLGPLASLSATAATTAATAAPACCTAMALLRVLAFNHEGRLNQPLMFITLYFLVTRLPESLRSVRDHFLSLDPTSLTADLLEQHLLAAETSAVAVGAARGTPRAPFFEGCSPSPLAPSYASTATVDVSVAEDGRAASASAKRAVARARVASVAEVAAAVVEVAVGVVVGAAVEVVAAVGLVEGVGALVAAVEAAVGVAAVAAVGLVAVGLALSVCSYVIRTGVRAGQTCGKLHTQHRCFSRLDDAWRAEFGEDVELHRWAYQLRSSIAIFDLDFDAILCAMYALSISTKGASESCTLPNTARALALHTFTLDFGASHCFFCDNTTLTPYLHLSRSDWLSPLGARSLTIPPLSCRVRRVAPTDAMVTTTTRGGQRVLICSCTRTGHHLDTFIHRPGSSLYTLATEPPHVAAFAQVSASGQVAASCSCCLQSHQTLLWHHRLGHPSLPRLRGMHSRLLVSGLPTSLPPLPPSPPSLGLPCVEGRQRAAPHSSLFPPTTAPLQTLHMDVWGPARVSGECRKRYFLLVVDDYTWYTTVFPLCSKGQVVDRFGQDLPVLRLHSVRGGEFSSNLLRDFCRGEGILQSLMLTDSPQQNGIAERRIGLVMEVARTSMIHAAAPHFLWPFAVRYAVHQLNLWPRVSLPETSPTLRWTGEFGYALVFRLNHPTSRRLFPSQDVTFDESVPLYHLFPYRSAPPQPPPLFLAPDPPPPGCVESEGAGSGGAEPGGEEPGGAEPVGVGPEGAGPGGAESEGSESGATRAGGAGGTAATGPGGARTRDPTEPGAVGARGTGTGGVGAGGAGAAGAASLDLGAGGAGDTPASPLPAPSPYTEQSGVLTKRREPASRPISPIRTTRPVLPLRPNPIPGTHAMALRPSSVPLCVPLLAPPESPLLEVPNPESDRARAASPTIAHLLTTAVIDPSFESATAFALVGELLHLAAACHLDYASTLVAESDSAGPPSVGGEYALGTDVLEDKQEDFECLAAAVPRFASMLLAPE